MGELWGLKSLLDCATDVGIVVVSERDDKILYCNHFVTIKTGWHAETSMEGVWAEYEELRSRLGESRSYIGIMEESPFGKNKNITLTKVVWDGGLQGIAILITPHIEDKAEQEREIVFKAVGNSYLSMYVLDITEATVTTLKENGQSNVHMFRPKAFPEWRSEVLEKYVFEEDKRPLEQFLDIKAIPTELEENAGRVYWQFRKKVGEEYHWCEYQLRQIDAAGYKSKVVITEKDIHGRRAINSKQLENEMIMKSLANGYRSVYLVDYKTGTYETVKPDELLFGIPEDGNYDLLLNIVEELIPDKHQQKDFRNAFEAVALREAFFAKQENVAREYNSLLSREMNWMSIVAFPTPLVQDMENKCVLTFMDITQRKQVEAERNEKKIVVDVLSAHYEAVYFVNLSTGEFHSIKVPQKYGYIEKQYKDFSEAIGHYAKAYVAEAFRESLKSFLSAEGFAKDCENGGEKRELRYHNIDEETYRVSVYPINAENTETPEVIVAFERCNGQ